MKSITILALILTTVQLSAQIQIDSADILTDIGTSWITLSYNDSINVSLGDSGGPHTWDFTSLASQLNDTSFYNLIDPLTSPLYDSFPDANLVRFRTNQNISDSVFEYINITSTFYRLLGIQQNSNALMGMVRIDSSTIYFPFSYGHSSSIYTFDTIIDNPDTFITVEMTRDMLVDGYGNVIISQGSYPCLRVFSHSTIHLSGYIVVVVPIPINITFSEYEYNWITESQPDLITITSLENETNPNFTVAGKVEMFQEYSSEINEFPIELTSEQINIVQEDNLYFLDLYNLSPSILKIYDLTGREIDQNSIEGTGRIYLELDQSGIYFVSIENYNMNIIEKINFLK
ncbi:MAG: hypothetical protein APR63_04570 [Desulfuromonas sp. SDB]|nr:MAG: hypothetical protein APR63_04570 [Desulfuromonas sp. SDB]